LASGRQVDIRIENGTIAAVDPSDAVPVEGASVEGASVGSGAAIEVHPLHGWLVVPAMAEPHAHLDKALTADLVPNPTGDLNGAIEAWVVAARTGRFSHDDTVGRASRAMELLLAHGVTAIRTHINTVPGVGAANVLALRDAASRFEGLLDLQIVALPSVPMVGPEGAPARRALADALTAGVDRVGGCPHLDTDGPGMIRLALEAAVEAGIGVDLHVDETLDPSTLTLPALAHHVLDTGFTGPVTASHCVSLGMQPPAVQSEVAALVAEAGIGVVTLPQTNLYLQGRDQPTATPRGLTAVAALQEAGVVVAAGGDNVQDPFNLVGRSDPLETAALLVMVGHRLPGVALDMVGNQARAALGLPAVELVPGAPADLVAMDAPSVRAAVATSPSRLVFRRGRLVASANREMTIHYPAGARHRSLEPPGAGL
jgi:cytosine deaminase